jgi:hypothetical protein
MSNHIQTLLRVLRGENDRLDWSPAETEWQRFAALCEVHQVAPFVFCQLKNTSAMVPEGLFEHLRQRFFEVSARNYRLAKEVVELTSFLREYNLPVVAFKGPVIAMTAYSDLALRQYQDIDLVVRLRDLGTVADLLVGRGFEIMPSYCRVASGHEVTLRAPDKSYFLDLHWRLASEQPRTFCPSVEQMLDRVQLIQLPQGRVASFCREDQFVALCCHGTKHQWGRLKWLLDISEMLRSPVSFNWHRVESITFDRMLARASVALAIQLAHDLLNAPVPAGLPKPLTSNKRTRSVASNICGEILTQGRTTGLEQRHSTLPRLDGAISTWMHYLWLRYPKWFFEHAIIRIDPKDRALVSLPEQLRFLYHIVRPMRLVGKHSARLARLVLANRY